MACASGPVYVVAEVVQMVPDLPGLGDLVLIDVGQQDPLVEFKKEAHEMFEEMMTRIKKRYAYICISFWIEVQE